MLAVAVEGWLFDELSAFGSDLEDLEFEPDEGQGNRRLSATLRID